MVDTFNPTPTTTQTVNLDHFFQNSGPLNTLIPAGTNFTLNVTPTSGSPLIYTLPTNAFTTEPVSFTGLTSSAISSLTFDAPVTFNWTLPTTFAPVLVKLNAQTFTGPQSNPSSFNCNIKDGVLSASATSGSITIPSTCNGQPVVQVNLNLAVEGPNGELSTAIYFYQ